MLPAPPPLSPVTDQWSDGELFWIVKHGIKYTGMPAWVALERDDEVWAVVAFLRSLPKLDAQGYRALAFGPVLPRSSSDQEIALSQTTTPDGVRTCGRCHGFGRHPPPSDLVPSLHGQSAEFLVQALQAYAKGVRASGIMQPVAAPLDEKSIRELAAYYAQLPSLPAEPKDGAQIEAGRSIALRGAPRDGVPACVSCHGADALPAYPRLAGQHAAYMINRLTLWKRGVRSATGVDAIMAPIARRLSGEDIAAVSAYFASASSEPKRQPER
jgi:cytochrome c553